MSDTSHSDDEPSMAVDEFVTEDRREFWRKIHAMSSAAYQPTLYTGALDRNISASAHHACPALGSDGAARRGYEDRQGR